MEIPLLQEMVIIFGLASFVLLACNRFRIPTIVGLLLTGIICGPHGLRFVEAVHEVEVLSEIGIVLLLFTIGLEFSLTKLMQSKKQVFIGGGLQVGITLLVGFAVSWVVGMEHAQSVFIGCAVALSSTAITLKFLQEKGLIASSYGRFVVAILIFQDMAAVPMMLITPLLAGTGQEGVSVWLPLLKGLVLVGIVFVTALSVVPRLLYFVARTRNYQLFLLFILLICFATAWMTSYAGLSLALGAFLAGLIISESEYSDHAVGHILPFQQVFSSFFFVSVGMLLDLSFVANNLVMLTVCATAVLLMKLAVAAGVARLLGYPLRAAMLAGLGLCQVGEFAFILLRQGFAVSLVSEYAYQLLLAVSLFTMLVGPFLMLAGPSIVNALFRLGLPMWLVGRDKEEDSEAMLGLRNHVVIVGFGVCGRNLAWAAKLAGVPYIIIELNPETVRTEREKGEPIIFGDATHRAILNRVHLRAAQMVVIAIDDPVATRAVVEAIRQVSPHVYLLVRTRYLKEIEPMLTLGADDVVPEEFETSVEIFSRVLTKYLIPENEIQKFCAEARSRKYEAFRSISPSRSTVSDLSLHLPDFKVEALRIPVSSSLVGLTIQEAAIRPRYNTTVLMVRRTDEDISNPSPETVLQPDDILVVFGEVKNLVELLSDLSED